MQRFTTNTFRFIAYAVLMSGLTLTTSCNKDDEPNPDATPSCKVTTITADDGDLVKFEYDANNRVIKNSDYEGTTLDDYNTYEYNANNKVIKINYYEENNVLESTTAIEYNDKGQWTKITDSEPGSSSSDIKTAEYNSNGERTKIIGSSETIVFEYSGGNVVKETYTYKTSTPSITTYEYYMDKENKLRNIEEISNIGYSPSAAKNMLKKTSYSNSYSSSSYSSTYTYVSNLEYEYNDKGFPTKLTSNSTSTNTTTNDGKTETGTSTDSYFSTVEYQCK